MDPSYRRNLCLCVYVRSKYGQSPADKCFRLLLRSSQLGSRVSLLTLRTSSVRSIANTIDSARRAAKTLVNNHIREDIQTLCETDDVRNVEASSPP